MEDEATIGRDFDAARVEANHSQGQQQLFNLGIGQGEAASSHGRYLCVGEGEGERRHPE